MEPKYWQVQAGKGEEGDRNYTDVFLRFGVFFGGDAPKGHYTNDPEYYDDNPYVKIIAKEMNIGDRIVLIRHRLREES